MAQETVVEYFISQMKEKYNVTPKDTTGGFFNIIGEFTEIVEQAKKMEKKQILDSYNHGFLEGEQWGVLPYEYDYKRAEEYYFETYIENKL